MDTSIVSIAHDLQLSKATVSSILSGKGEEKGFNQNTIKRVKEYADSVGYMPNLLARSLSTGVTKTIGLVIPAIGDTFYSQLAQCIETALEEKGFSLIVASSERDPKKELDLIKLLRSKRVDGLIIAPTQKNVSGTWNLIDDSFPFVFIDRYYPELNTNYVIVDNQGGAFRLVENMIHQGAGRIAAITSDTQLYVMRERLSGYRKALSEAAIPVDESLIVEVDRSSYNVDLHKKLETLLAVHWDIDGFFFATHYLALEAIRFFDRVGIDFKRRFTLGCFHTTTGLDILAPKMVFSLMPVKELGTEASNLLLENISTSGAFTPRGILLHNTLI